MKAVVLAAQPLLDPLAERYFGPDVEVRIAPSPAQESLIAATEGVQAVFARAGTWLGTDLFEAAGDHLLAVTSLGSGVDMIDVDAATAAGVPVLHNPGVAPTPVVEYVIGMIPVLRKRIVEADRAIRSGWDWAPRSRFFGRQVTGYTLGIVGFGHIGQEVARRARAAFDMEVLAYDPPLDPSVFAAHGVSATTDLPELLRRSDVVTLHAPELPATRHIIDAAALAEMKDDAVLINAARGGLVDDEALVAALANGEIAAAAMDVFTPEPPATDHPLFALPNFVATPHTAGMTEESLTALHRSMAEGLVQALQGHRPTHLANPDVWPPRAADTVGYPLS